MSKQYVKRFSLEEATKKIAPCIAGTDSYNSRWEKENPNYSLVKQLREIIAKNKTVYVYSEISKEYGRALYFNLVGCCRSIAKVYVEIDCHSDSYEEEVLRPAQREAAPAWSAADMAKVKMGCELWNVGYCKFFYLDNGELVSLEGTDEVDNWQ